MNENKNNGALGNVILDELLQDVVKSWCVFSIKMVFSYYSYSVFVLPPSWPRGVTLVPQYWQLLQGGREEEKNSIRLSRLHEKLKGIYFLVGSQAENTIWIESLSWNIWAVKFC